MYVMSSICDESYIAIRVGWIDRERPEKIWMDSVRNNMEIKV